MLQQRDCIRPKAISHVRLIPHIPRAPHVPGQFLRRRALKLGAVCLAAAFAAGAAVGISAALVTLSFCCSVVAAILNRASQPG